MPLRHQSLGAPLYRHLKINRMHLSCAAAEESSGRYPLRYTQFWTPSYDKLIQPVCVYMKADSRHRSTCMVSELLP